MRVDWAATFDAWHWTLVPDTKTLYTIIRELMQHKIRGTNAEPLKVRHRMKVYISPSFLIKRRSSMTNNIRIDLFHYPSKDYPPFEKAPSHMVLKQ